MNNNLLEIDLQNQEIHFNFGGFYNSKHLSIIESGLESTLSDIQSDQIKDFKENELFDFENTKINYAKALLKLLDKEFNTNFLECFKKIWSPQYYNYHTDTIILDYQKFSFKDSETIKEIKNFMDHMLNYKINTFLQNIESEILEFEIAFFKLDGENLKKFIDDNLNLDSEILETILDNLENIKGQNFCDFDEFKQYLVDVYDNEIIYYDTALEFLKDHDRSLRNSLKLANDLGLELKNLNSEILASLLKEDIFRDLLNDNNEDLETIFNLLENQ